MDRASGLIESTPDRDVGTETDDIREAMKSCSTKLLLSTSKRYFLQRTVKAAEAADSDTTTSVMTLIVALQDELEIIKDAQAILSRFNLKQAASFTEVKNIKTHLEEKRVKNLRRVISYFKRLEDESKQVVMHAAQIRKWMNQIARETITEAE